MTKAKFWGWPGKGTWNCAGGLWNCRGFVLFVRSNVTVGNGAEAEIVAMLDEQPGSIARASRLGFIIPSALDIDPESSIVAAAVVVDAIVIAAGGRGWL